ncbi:MAG: hypothetical protein BGO01_04635 [Armatimonadetes bacterium 55-13]|nr:MAG: hypothetical protein ABT09_00530 [bacterium SCN 57-13]OJU63430.1 MAG: hypothetical protein BGO01_04635 [Armatimonadetes bacterium 55-13]
MSENLRFEQGGEEVDEQQEAERADDPVERHESCLPSLSQARTSPSVLSTRTANSRRAKVSIFLDQMVAQEGDKAASRGTRGVSRFCQDAALPQGLCRFVAGTSHSVQGQGTRALEGDGLPG